MNQRIQATLLVVLIWLLHLGIINASSFTEDRPHDYLGACDDYGFLSIWRELKKVKNGSVELPFRLKFTSNPIGKNSGIGLGWSSSLLSSTSYLVDERTLIVYTLGGKDLRLKRRKKSDPTFTSRDGVWSALIKEDGCVSMKATNGDLMEYKGGRLSSANIDGNSFSWSYNSQGKVTSIRGNNAQTLVDATYNERGLMEELNVNATRYKLKYGQFPVIQSIGDQVVVGKLGESLAEISSGNFKLSYEYALTPARLMTMEEKNVSAPANKFSWSGKNFQIVSENDWNYKIEKNENVALVKASRSNQLTGVKEAYFYDMKKAVGTELLSNGVSLQTSYYTQRGQGYGAPRKVTETRNGVETLVFQRSIDEQGRTIRELREGIYTYHIFPGAESPDKLGEKDMVVTYDDKGRVIERLYAGNRSTIEYLMDGSSKEVVDLGNGKKFVKIFGNDGQVRSISVATIPKS